MRSRKDGSTRPLSFYKLVKKAIEQQNQPKLSVSVNTFHRVEIMAIWAEVQASKCPDPDQHQLPRSVAAPQQHHINSDSSLSIS